MICYNKHQVYVILHNKNTFNFIIWNYSRRMTGDASANRVPHPYIWNLRCIPKTL